ncbi:MAG: 4-hydroxythreonine-4-phosphate dehydrogenase PdxA [candidate division WOR-3 bacterium]
MKIAVTIGDPAGIGPELVLKTLPAFLRYSPVIYGNHAILGQTARKLGLLRNYYLMRKHIENSVPTIKFEFGKPDEETGKVALHSIKSALADHPDIIITAPIVKNVIKKFFKNFIGQTEFLADYFKTRNFAMVGLLKEKKIMFLTTHLPVADIPEKINKEEICNKLVLFDHGLRKFFGIRKPNLAVSTLNPHGAEFGYGEEKIIEQGIGKARNRGITVSGPFPADSIFDRKFDGFLVMYHDQGFVYLKAKRGGLNWTLGLPVIRLSPLYGAALDIAGKNCADTTGMINALRMGIKMYHQARKELI